LPTIVPEVGRTAGTESTAGRARHRCLWLTKGLGRGGVERLLLDMLALVDTDRFEIDVAYVLPWKNDYQPALEELGARVTCLGRGSSRSPRWAYELARLQRQRGYDLIHSHAPVPGVAARLLTRWGAAPALVHTEHNVWDRYRWPTRAANAVTINRNQVVVAVSDKVAASIQPPFGRHRPRIETIHHGTVLDSIRSFSPEDRAARRAVLGLPERAFVLGKVATMTAKKDHPTLLRALAGEGPIAQVHLMLVGTGPVEQDVRRLAGELGISDRVTFLGSRDDVFELLPLLDAFVLSSRHEGFPISLVEAMATGLPCVATTVGGIPEILRHEVNGLLVPPGRPDELRAAITRFVTETALAAACGTAARSSAESLDLRQCVATLQELYIQALTARSHSSIERHVG
jgi:glycosyltransferase involved in cell wall biosynthesis